MTKQKTTKKKGGGVTTVSVFTDICYGDIQAEQGDGLRGAEGRISPRMGWEAGEGERHSDIWGRGFCRFQPT